MSKRWYLIKDFDSFVDHARSLVFKFFGTMNDEINDPLSETLSVLNDMEAEELDKVLSHDESALIIRNHTKISINPKTKVESFKITDEILYKVLEELNSRLVSNILAQLVNKNILETAFDNEKNDFVFWIKNEPDNNKKPKTD